MCHFKTKKSMNDKKVFFNILRVTLIASMSVVFTSCKKDDVK